jgi:serine/threonine protein kinase
MAQLKCPLLDELSALVTCRLSEVEAERIYAHLEVCPECDATVTELELNRQPLIPEGNEGPTDVPFEQEPAFQRMMAAVMGGSTAILEADSISGSTDVFEKSLGKYVIIEKVGEGGMGIVYRARHRQLNRIVALKVLQSSRLNDVAAISRFRREISLVGQLQHPNIVQAHDGGEEDGVHFLVMEFVEGRNLSEIVRQNGPLTIAAACELTIQATIGLQYAFERGLIHRDIKPSNLMLTAGDRTSEGERPIVKILDLGLARLLDSNANPFERINKLTMSGQVIGTVDYMAPEQGGDSHAVDIRADLYALGAVLFELLTGAPPYSKFSQLPPLQKLMAIARNPPPAIRTLRPEVPKRLAAIVARLLSKQPETRYATPREVTLALQPFRSGADLAVLLACTDSIVSYRSTIQSNRPSLAPRRQLSKRVIWGVFVVATVLSCGVSLVVSQARGVVVLESPDGQLPVDVKVIVLRGGEEIAVLQANNQWRATIRSGPIDLQMTKGQERFELVDSSRVVNRFGKNIVSLSQRLSNLEQPVLATPGATQKKPLSKTVRMTLANPDVRNAAIRLLKEARAELGLTRNWADSEKSSSSDIWFVSTEADLPSDDMIVTEILIVNGPSISDLWTLIDRFPHLTTLKLDYHITPMDCDRIGMLTELRALSVGAASDQLALCLAKT